MKSIMLYLIVSSAAFTIAINTIDVSSFAPRMQANASTQINNATNSAIVDDVDVTASLESFDSFYDSMVKRQLSDVDLMVLSYSGKDLLRTLITCPQAEHDIGEWVNNVDENMDMSDFYNFTAHIESLDCPNTQKSA
tara:strand:+ start:671 stop:1081 length:411 start_codon:yes stop_codon:yes gene_type:complete